MIVLLTALPGHAWEHTGFVWELQETPLEVIVDPTMPDAEEWVEAFQRAADAWAATPTELTLSVEMADSGPLSNDSSPGHILVLSDLTGNVGAGIVAATYSYASDDAYSTGRESYVFFEESDIVINDGEAFVGIDEACDGDENIREIVAVHELGHALGLGHSCEEDDGCDDELLAGAVMYWDASGCTGNAMPNADDLDGLGQLYDAAGGWSISSGGEVGETPREICFAIQPNGIDADHVAWKFGDGATGDGDETCHAFQTPGKIDVEVTYFSERNDEVPRSSNRTITACPTPPGPIEGAKHLFDLNTFETQIEIVPTVDAYWPCVDSVRWSVLRDGETLYDLPVSKSLVDVGKYGKYTVVLRTGGYGGVGEEERTVTLEPYEDCSTVHPRGGLAPLSLVMAALCRRRIVGR